MAAHISVHLHLHCHRMCFELRATDCVCTAMDGLGPDRAVGIATGYGVDGPGNESRLVEIFHILPDRPCCPPSHPMRGGVDKSLARPTTLIRETESLVSLERGVFSCAALQVFFLETPKGSTAVTRCPARSTHNTAWNTCCCHNTAQLITMYFYWLIYRSVILATLSIKFPAESPGRPKHVAPIVGLLM